MLRNVRGVLVDDEKRRLFGALSMKPFVTVLGDNAPSQYHAGLMWSWSRDQRQAKEYNIRRFQGVRPLYRINLKPRRP